MQLIGFVKVGKRLAERVDSSLTGYPDSSANSLGCFVPSDILSNK